MTAALSTPRKPALATTTKSMPPPTSVCRKTSRTMRLMRLRSTARAKAFRDIARPSRDGGAATISAAGRQRAATLNKASLLRVGRRKTLLNSAARRRRLSRVSRTTKVRFGSQSACASRAAGQPNTMGHTVRPSRSSRPGCFVGSTHSCVQDAAIARVAGVACASAYAVRRTAPSGERQGTRRTASPNDAQAIRARSALGHQPYAALAAPRLQDLAAVPGGASRAEAVGACPFQTARFKCLFHSGIP